MTITYGSLEHRRGAEPLTVEVERGERATGVEVVGEGEREAEDAGELCAVAARPEQDDLWRRRRRRGRDEVLPQAAFAPDVAQQAHEVEEIAGEVVGAECVRRAAEGGRRPLIGAGRPAEAEVDATGVERFERRDLLGHDQRGVVGQHDAARADPDAIRAGRQVGHQDRRGRARHRGHVVMLGHPEAVVAERFGLLGDDGCVGKGLGGRAAGDDDGEVEDRQRRSGGLLQCHKGGQPMRASIASRVSTIGSGVR